MPSNNWLPKLFSFSRILKVSFIVLKMNFRFFLPRGGEIFVEWTTSQWIQNLHSAPNQTKFFRLLFSSITRISSEIIMNFRASHSSINIICFFSHHHVINCFYAPLSVQFKCSRLHSADLWGAWNVYFLKVLESKKVILINFENL